MLPALTGLFITGATWFSIHITSKDHLFFDRIIRRLLTFEPSNVEVVRRRFQIFPGIDPLRPEALNLIDTYFAIIFLALLVSPFLALPALRRFLIAITLGLLLIGLGPAAVITYLTLHTTYFLLLHRFSTAAPHGDGPHVSANAATAFLLAILVGPYIIHSLTSFSVYNFGLGLFCLEGPRLLLHRAEVLTGVAEKKITLESYLMAFLNPGGFVSYAPQGHRHISDSFRNAELSKIWNRGSIATLEGLGAFIAGHSLIRLLAEWGERTFDLTLDPELHRSFALMANFNSGSATPSKVLLSVLLSGVLHLGVVMMLLMSVLQLRIGVWRFLGFNVESAFRFPYFASSLAETWMRFSIHYRICLSRVFYEPVFWKLQSMAMATRVSVATLFSIIFGGLVFHTLQRGAISHFTPSTVVYSFATLPYYLFLGSGVAFSQWLILRNGRRPFYSRHPFFGSLLIRAPLTAVSTLGVILFLGFTHLLASPETGYDGWDVIRMLWSTVWKIQI